MNVSPRPNLLSAEPSRGTYTSASFAIRGFPIAMIIAWAVVIVPATECSKTADVLQISHRIEGRVDGIRII